MEILENLWMLIEVGGPVMIPIFLVSGWLWGLIALKADWVWRTGRDQISLSDAMICLKSGQVSPSNSPRALAINHFMTTDNGTRCQNKDADKLLFDAAIRKQAGAIQKYIPTIIILAAVAPLLGLFGTVSGMVETFKVIGMYGMGNAQAMASGIKEAMITTQAGLLVAIPGIFIGQVLKKKANNIQQDLLVFQRGIVQWLDKECEL
ncbi:MotA/TolQ/ExbB proton channel family protein [Desulfogranum japonicum]|uniref:MotA/TolQ/ExbB proton channel family protein n=1 Tax=Desulfogranum japonicum TaxID=231447 RepID=UPI000424F6B8|nr:MotA/TolQ/ExbB proton channel family protein [Desulfogranum japonicum]